METKRASWASNLGFLMAAIGSAVGLGNIWGFPYKMGKSGGFAYLAVYALLAIFVGFIVMASELAMGRKTGQGAMGTYHALTKKFRWIGWLALFSPFAVMGFYAVLGGYCIEYMALNLSNLAFGSESLATGGELFAAMLSNPAGAVLFAALFLALCYLINRSGISGGIEKFNNVGMPTLFVMLVVIIIRSLTLPGAMEGLKFMFVPGYAVEAGFVAETPSLLSVFASAGGQMFFSLSLGAGVMITYGSYLDKKQDLGKSTMIIVGMDTVVALMAGLCVIPGRFALDPDGALGGPELLFITMQNVFDKMGPAGPVFGILFYLLVFFAAISSSISMLEVIVAHFCDKAREKGKGDRRKLYSAIAVVICAALCALVCADGMGSNHISPAELLGLAGAKLPGWSTSWLGLFDSVAEGLLMPLGALLMCLMISWELKPDALRQEILLNGENRPWVYDFFRLCVKYITPLCMLMILYGQISDFFIA